MELCGVTHTVLYSHTLKYPCTVNIAVIQLAQYGRKNLRKAKIYFSLYLSLFCFAHFYIPPSRSATTQSYLERQVLLPISQRDIESSRSENRDHGACRSKCMSAIFEVGLGRLPTGMQRETNKRGKMGGVLSTYPNFHKVRNMKGSLGKYRCRSTMFPSRRRNGTVQNVN